MKISDMHICIITQAYPSPRRSIYPFIDQLARAMSRAGARITVIAPQSKTKIILGIHTEEPFYSVEKVPGGKDIEIYRPHFFTISHYSVFGVNSQSFFTRVAMKTFESLKDRPNILYSQFWTAGITAAKIGMKYGLPAFTDCGESVIQVTNVYNIKKIKSELDYMNGVVAVSSENKDQSVALGLCTPDKAEVFPNGYDPEVFKVLDKKAIRRELGFPEDAFIMIFTGQFIDRKGPLRICEALQNEKGIYKIFVGGGKEKPYGDDILFCGRLSHGDIVKYLNASDIFVLPTLAEGCCNAIIEAIACHLPVVTSDLPCNVDITNDSCALLINPESITEIHDAVCRLRDDAKLREKLSLGAKQMSEKLIIDKRATDILDFINRKSASGK